MYGNIGDLILSMLSPKISRCQRVLLYRICQCSFVAQNYCIFLWPWNIILYSICLFIKPIMYINCSCCLRNTNIELRFSPPRKLNEKLSMQITISYMWLVKNKIIVQCKSFCSGSSNADMCPWNAYIPIEIWDNLYLVIKNYTLLDYVIRWYHW